MEHFFDKNSYKICLRCIFSKACNSNASKMHKIGYMRPPRGSQDASRTARDGFCLRFGRQLGAKLEPCWPLFPPKTLPWRLQDEPRCHQESSGSPKTAGSMGYPSFGRHGPMGYSIFWWICWAIFGWFLVHFSSIFHSISRFKKQASQHQKTKNQNSKVQNG